MSANRMIVRSDITPAARRTIAVATLFVLVVQQAATAQTAQQFATLPHVKDSPEFSKRKTEFFSTGKTDDVGKKVFSDHYTFRIAEMTLPDNFNRLSNKREDIKKNLAQLGRAPDTQLHDQLTEFLVGNLPKWCADARYHPAVRQNWTLILGDLNSVEPQFGGGGAVPLAASFPELRKLYVDENQHLAVRLAALYGMTRHLKPTVTPDARKQLAQAMTAIVANNKPPKGVDQNAHDYFRRRTIDGLRAIIELTPEAGDAAVATALAAMTADAKVSLQHRCEAASALGLLEGGSFKKEEVPQLARTLGDMAVQIVKRSAPPPAPPPTAPILPPAAAAPAAAPPADAKAPPADAKPPSAGPPVAPVAPKKPKPALPREVQAYFLACVRQGFKGSRPTRGLAGVSVEPETKKLVDDLSAKVEEMLKLVMDKKVEDDALPAQLATVNQALQDLLKAPSAGADKARPAAQPALEKVRANP